MKVYVVDDDKDAVAWVKEALEEYGDHTVTKVDTVAEAEAAFSSGKWEYELFIIDVQIKPGPGETTTEEESLVAGITLYRKFRSRFERAKVLILTNNLYRVPVELFTGNPYTRARDKVDVAGRKLVDAIRNW